MKLSKEAFERAGNFVKQHGRPLEVARFAYHFEGETADAVVAQLSSYQNRDGGFGHGLEPDLRTANSSALATSVAFQMIREVPDHDPDAMVQAAVTYLIQSFDPQNSTWRIIPSSAGDSPHAPWWNQEGTDDRFSAFSLNPTAELLGYIIEFSPENATPAFVNGLSNRVLSHIDRLDEMEMHEYQCCLRLSQTPGLPSEYRERLVTKLLFLLPGIVSLDSTAWSGYTILPLQVAESPDSPFFNPVEALVAENLTFELRNQSDDGSWWPLWSWGDAYTDVWPLIEKEWMGVLTMAKLLTFKKYNAIEGLG